jgi:hypothetical protein
MDKGDPTGGFQVFSAGTMGRVLPVKEGVANSNIATRPGNNSTCSVTCSGATTFSRSGTAFTPGTAVTPFGAAVADNASRKRKSTPSGLTVANNTSKKCKSRKAPGAKE